MGIRNETTPRASIAPIVGLACLWPSLHASPYYPLPLTAAFAANGLADISANHIIYSILLICILSLLVGMQKHARAFLFHLHQIAVAGGCSGVLGSALLIASGYLGSASTIVVGIGFMLIAFYVASSAVAWLSAIAQKPARTIAVEIALSYCLFSAVWLALLAFGLDFSYLLAACPALSAACLALQPVEDREPSSFAPSSLKTLPLGIIALCVIFIYFGVVCVRVLTTMQQGVQAAGGLTSLHHIVTASTGLVICLFLALYYRKKEYSLESLITVFAFFVLVYMAALLAVMMGSSSDPLAMAGKRVLVGAEHCLEVFLAIVLACNVSKRRLSPLMVFGLYAVVIFVIPQLLSLDLMYQSGLLEALAHMDLILPLAAAASFAVAAISIGLLTSYFSRASKGSAEQKDDWQEELCRKATEAIEVSPREFDVIVLTYRGYSARKIAEALLVSESTVKTHVSHAYRKLGIHSKQELIALVDSYRQELDVPARYRASGKN